MSEDRWRLIEEVFQRAMDLPARERSAFVRAACEGQPELLDEVLGLVLAAEDGSTFIERPATDDILQAGGVASSETFVGQRVGAYEAVGLVGIGGMGAVYEARRADGQFEQRVAIKVMRADLASGPNRRRFDQEQQTLARLEHAGIARLIDGGTLRDGRPYLVMEFVEGVRIDHYCGSLGLEACIGVFLQAAEAVQHAHQNLVIHRDLKPSNILVEPNGTVRVIDFGIALPLYLSTGETMVTEARDILGTLAYMSPEQCRRGAGAALDVRSDVYSLGVVLYQLVTGRVPHDLETLSVFDAIRAVSETPPVRPAQINPRAAGDLEIIICKAMNAEVDQRYASVAEFSADLRRYLAREPIVARRPSTLYLSRKFWQRHRLGVTLGSAFAAALLITAMVAVWQAQETKQSRAAEREQFEEAEWVGYTASLAAAAEALRSHRPQLALSWLEQTPDHLRSWEWDHLRGRVDQAELELVESRGETTDVEVSADGSMVVPVTMGQDLVVVDTRSGRAIQQFENAASIRDVALVPDGERVLWCQNTPWIVVGDIGSGETHRVQLEHSVGVRQLALSPDGRVLAVGLNDGRVHILDAPHMQVQAELEIPGGSRITHLEFSADGRLLVGSVWTGESQGNVFVWETTAWSNLAVVRGPPRIIDRLAISPDGAYVATGMTDQRVRIYRLPGLTPIGYPIECEDVPKGLAFSPDSSILAIGSLGRVRMVDVESGAETATGHLLGGRLVGLKFVPDGATLVAATERGRVVTLTSDVEEVSTLRLPGEWIFDLAFNSAGTRVFAVDRVWNTESLEVVHVNPQEEQCVSAARSPDGEEICTVAKSWIRIRDADTGRVLREVRVEQGEAWSVAWHPSGEVLAIGGRFGCPVHLRNAKTLEVIRSMPDSSRGETRAVRFSPDGRWLAGAVLKGGGVVVWESESGECRLQTGEVHSWWDVDWSPNGAFLAAGGSSREVVLWSTGDWRVAARYQGHDQTIMALRFHPTAAILASGSRDQSVRLWDTTRGSQLLALLGHRARVRSLKWSPAGDVLATGDESGVIRLWSREQDVAGPGLTTGRAPSILETPAAWSSPLGGRGSRAGSSSTSPEGLNR